MLIPPFVRNIGYKIVAATRYKVFGKNKGVCAYVPGLRKRFLDMGFAESESRSTPPGGDVKTNLSSECVKDV